MDIHQNLADELNTSRHTAKLINFSKLYTDIGHTTMITQDGTVDLSKINPYDSVTYSVPSFLVCAFAYGDYTGLTDEEVQAVGRFIDKLPPGNTTLDFSFENYFDKWHDVDGIGACDCVEMTVTWITCD